MSYDYPRKTKGREIFNRIINSKPSTFWAVTSQEGVNLMKQCRKELMKLGNGIFDGYPERGWTCTTNADKIDSLTRRINRWETELKRMAS